MSIASAKMSSEARKVLEESHGASEAPWGDAARQLSEVARQGLWRELRPSSSAVGPRIARGGRVLWNFSSNNYLDLATHPHVVARASEALARYGAGAGGSRLITGALQLHEELEARLAALKSTESALVFSCGYLANLGVVQALSRRADGARVPIVFDKFVHASLIDAVQLSGAPWKSFRHNDVEAAHRAVEALLGAAGGVGSTKEPRVLIVTEGVFSMDGDVAPLAELYGLAEKVGGLLLVDDAHGTGVVGDGGSGAAAWAGVAGQQRLVQVGTLSKALGAQGGFVAGPDILRRLLVNKARGFIFETGLAPASAAAALGALEVLEREPERLVELRRRADLLRSALRAGGAAMAESPSAIVPVVVGDARRAVEWAQQLERAGFLAVAIRPPTVPPGSARLRLTVMATHPLDVVEHLACELTSLMAGGDGAERTCGDGRPGQESRRDGE